MVSARPIATLPSTWSRLPYLSIISLPDGVKCWPVGTVKPWVHDSGLYLVHVKELQLRVWLHVMDSGKWLLQNTICLHEVGIDVLYIHTRSRNAEKVYTVKPEEEEEPWIRLIPFVMIWPPIFPKLQYSRSSETSDAPARVSVVRLHLLPFHVALTADPESSTTPAFSSGNSSRRLAGSAASAATAPLARIDPAPVPLSAVGVRPLLPSGATRVSRPISPLVMSRPASSTLHHDPDRCRRRPQCGLALLPHKLRPPPSRSSSLPSVVSVSWKRIARGVKKEEEKKTDYSKQKQNIGVACKCHVLISRKFREVVGDNNTEVSCSNVVWFIQANLFSMPMVYPNPPTLQCLAYASKDTVSIA
ncbi:hypothetical protein EJB05_24146, partial [Eragrostis curvula]